MERRKFLKTSAMGALLAGLSTSGIALAEESAQAQESFSFDLLTQKMRERAQSGYEPAEVELQGPMADLDYDRHRAIRFLPDRAAWKGESPFEIQAFHMGWLFREPVHVFSVEDAQSRPLKFSADDFEYRSPLDHEEFEGIEMPGIAGLRMHYGLNRPDVKDELAAFLGASYFRALGRGNVYGLSARGIAINTGTQRNEQFPRFDSFYLEKPAEDARQITMWATMDGQSVTGAFEFVITPGQETVIDVTARLFLRENVDRLGVAPLTSMFLFARNNRSAFRDFRNAVHDSDGLMVVRHDGERVWRNLNNPGRLATSFLSDENPIAFGLFQRDRNFENYQDAEAHYEMRPSLLIEPLHEWGRGSVALIEIPTDLEINDNIVAFWVPEGDMRAGQELEFRYRMRWGGLDEDDGSLARVHALRAGEGGVAGVQNDPGLQKFVVDFHGGPLARVNAQNDDLESNVRVWNAEIRGSVLSRIAANGVWRLTIDIGSIGSKPVELSAFLALAGTRVSETWLYQWRPEDERRS